MKAKVKTIILFYCLSSDIEKQREAYAKGYRVRAIDRFDGSIEPGNIEKVIIAGYDKHGCSEAYKEAGMKVEVEKGVKVDKVEKPKEETKPEPAPSSADAVSEDEPEPSEDDIEKQKAELIKQGEDLGLKLTKNMKPETMLKKIQEASDKEDENEEDGE